MAVPAKAALEAAEGLADLEAADQDPEVGADSAVQEAVVPDPAAVASAVPVVAREALEARMLDLAAEMVQVTGLEALALVMRDRAEARVQEQDMAVLGPAQDMAASVVEPGRAGLAQAYWLGQVAERQAARLVKQGLGFIQAAFHR